MRIIKDKRIFSQNNRVIWFGNCFSEDKPKRKMFQLVAYIDEVAENIKKNY